MTRRDLIQKMILGGATLMIVPSAVESCTKQSLSNSTGGPDQGTFTIDLTKSAYAALNTPGGSVIVQGIIVANKDNSTFLALDSVCTHQGCIIGYNPAANNFPCPCHGSVFSSTGAVINGPAAIPLKSYPVSKSGNTLTVTL